MSTKSIFEEEKHDIYAKAYYRFINCSHQIELHIKKALKAYSITHVQLNILYILAKYHPTVIPVFKIKKELIVHNPDLTRLLDRLETKELISRKICLDNRRRFDVSITKKGLDLFEKAHLDLKKSLHQFFAEDLTEEEAIQWIKIMNKIELS